MWATLITWLGLCGFVSWLYGRCVRVGKNMDLWLEDSLRTDALEVKPVDKIRAQQFFRGEVVLDRHRWDEVMRSYVDEETIGG